MSPEVTQANPESNLIQEKIDISSQKLSNISSTEAETDKEINWKKFKEERRKERELSESNAKKAQEKEAEAEALKAAMDAILNKTQQPNQQQYNNGSQYQEEETEDQRIEKKVQAMLVKREAEIDRLRQEKEHKEFPQRLESNHPDFNQVCNTENLDYLEYHYPEVAQAFRHMPDGFDKWSTIYKAVKRFVPNLDTRKDQAKIDRNMSKPQSLSSSGTMQSGTPITSSRLDESRKAENWKRMERVRKGLN